MIRQSKVDDVPDYLCTQSSERIGRNVKEFVSVIGFLPLSCRELKVLVSIAAKRLPDIDGEKGSGR